MSERFDTSSELVEISKLNGGFRRNYGTFIGAYLYLRSISAARGRSLFWTGLISIACSAALAWLAKHGLAWLHVDQRIEPAHRRSQKGLFQAGRDPSPRT